MGACSFHGSYLSYKSYISENCPIFCNVDLYSLLSVQSVADVVRRGLHDKLRWFGHLERRSVDDWVDDCLWMIACRKVEMAGTRCRGRNRKSWKECVDDDMEVLGLHPEWAVFRDVWRDFIWANV